MAPLCPAICCIVGETDRGPTGRDAPPQAAILRASSSNRAEPTPTTSLGLPDDQPILVFGSAVQGERSESRSDGVAALDRRAGDQTIHRRGGRVLHRHTGAVHLALTAYRPGAAGPRATGSRP